MQQFDSIREAKVSLQGKKTKVGIYLNRVLNIPTVKKAVFTATKAELKKLKATIKEG